MNSVLIGPGSTRQTRDPLRVKLAAQGVVPVGQAGLGRAISSQRRVGHASDRRADIDDHPFPFDQRRQAEPRQHERGREVDGELPSQVLGHGVRRNRVGRPRPALLISTSSPPNRADRFGNQALGRRRIGQVGRDGQDLKSGLSGPQLRGELVKPIAPAGRQDESPALSFVGPARVPGPLRCRRRRRSSRTTGRSGRRGAPSAGIVSRSLDRFGHAFVQVARRVPRSLPRSGSARHLVSPSRGSRRSNAKLIADPGDDEVDQVVEPPGAVIPAGHRRAAQPRRPA